MGSREGTVKTGELASIRIAPSNQRGAEKGNEMEANSHVKPW
jgi:hypothetical protein